MGDIQFTPVDPPPAPPPAQTPGWLHALIEWLAARIAPLGNWLALHWRTIETAGGVALVAGLLWLAWALWRGHRIKRKLAPAAAPDGSGWAPDAARAAVLLADADRLANAERYDEAVHLLLRRSFEDIANIRPDWLTPASTAREVASVHALPAPARAAFAVIAEEVERSRYRLRPLHRPDWLRARDAYAAFAVPAPR
jgi:hypothetical protein